MSDVSGTYEEKVITRTKGLITNHKSPKYNNVYWNGASHRLVIKYNSIFTVLT